jgi:hypothetical protein
MGCKKQTPMQLTEISIYFKNGVFEVVSLFYASEEVLQGKG